MCGISGAFIRSKNHRFWDLVRASDIRGQDGTGVTILRGSEFITRRWECRAKDVRDFPELEPGDMVIAQNRLAIFGLDHANDQPLLGKNVALVHNGNLDARYPQGFDLLGYDRELQVDSELLLRILEDELEFQPQRHHIFGESIEAKLGGIQLPGNWACLALVKGMIPAWSRFRHARSLVAFVHYKPLFRARDCELNVYFLSTERIGAKALPGLSLVAVVPGRTEYEAQSPTS